MKTISFWFDFCPLITSQPARLYISKKKLLKLFIIQSPEFCFFEHPYPPAEAAEKSLETTVVGNAVVGGASKAQVSASVQESAEKSVVTFL